MRPKLTASILAAATLAFVASCLVTAPGDDELVGSCTDGIRNGDEADVDCGAECPLCGATRKCKVNENCVSDLCDQGTCREATCTDGAQNGDESDRDCGGSCTPCGVGAICQTGADCVTATCTGARCAQPSCTDGVKNGTEVDVDCGFDTPFDCPLCADGQMCGMNDDCESYSCVGGTCTEPTCDDEQQNGFESDVDCGGGECPRCMTGAFCNENADCVTNVCDDVDFTCS